MGQAPSDAVIDVSLPAEVAGCPVHADLNAANAGMPTVVTLGRFDGLHQGHRALLRATVEAARDVPGARALAITLWPPPEWVLRPEDPRALLSTLQDRLALMANTGVDAIVVLTFGYQFSQQSPRDFLGQLLNDLHMVTLVTGPNARIGKDGAGTPDVLRELSGELGFQYREIEWRGHSPMNRSSAIRQSLADGDIASVNEGLGRAYSLPGVVVQGSGVGQRLGFPTANLSHSSWLQVPGDGVYAGIGLVDAVEGRRAAISVGTRPTYGGETRVVEANLLEYDDDLYGRDLRLFFVKRLRDQQSFECTKVLKEWIANDVTDVRELPELPHDDLAPFIEV